MTAERIKALFSGRSGWGFVILAASAGLLLLLWTPSGGGGPGEGGEKTEETRIEALLTGMEGVGEAHVLLSEHGAVIVCSGADDPSVCLRVTQAVKCYTGLGADGVKIFKSSSDGG